MKQGQLLAEIDTPEVDQQLRQARADLATAQANAAGEDDRGALAGSDQERLGLASRRSTTRSGYKRDEGGGGLGARQRRSRLEQLQAFQKIYAPFDGVITARNTDIGALIDAGSTIPRAGSCSTSRPSTRCASS